MKPCTDLCLENTKQKSTFFGASIMKRADVTEA